MTEILVSATLIASGVRALVVLSGLLVLFSSRERKIEWGRSMRVAFPEPFLLLLATVWLAAIGPIAPASVPGSHGAVASAAIVAGVLSSLFGVVLFSGSLWFNRGVGTGHYVDEDQVIVDAGPYAIMRHPLYAAAIFI